MNNKKAYSVFLVDDNSMFLTTLKSSLQERFGDKLKIKEFGTGEECIEHLNENPDIIFLDYYLNANGHPDAINGIKVLKEIKAISKDIDVIMLSGQDKLEVAIDAIKYGAHDYIAKSESAFVRIQNLVTNLIESIGSTRKSKKYFKMNIVMATIILTIVLVDVVMYAISYH